MDYEDEEYRDLLAQWGLRGTAPAHEPMRGRRRTTRNPSRDDLKVRRQNGRRTAAETITAGGEVQKRATLVGALLKAASLAEQARLLDEITKLDNAKTAAKAQSQEVDFASAVVRQTMAPVRVHEHHTAATDWIGYEESVPQDWQNRVVAEAATWFGRVPDFVKADGEEFTIQAQGKAQQFAGQFGIQATAARQTFEQYAAFLRTQSASGLDQIQQTVDPHDNPKTTPLNPEVFDNFAPDVDPINAGVSGTEDSNRAPLIQEIVGGGSGMDGGAPEKPSEHDEGPAFTASLISAPSVAIGGFGYTMDDFRREAAAKQGGPGKAEGGTAAPSVRTAAKCKDCHCELSGENRGGKGRCINCEGRKGGKAAAKEAASGLDQIQQTVDPHDNPAPTGLPPEVGFPLDPEFEPEWSTNGTGEAQPTKAASRKVADMFGASDTPHSTQQQQVPNSPATTPPNADQAGGRGAGTADASSHDKPSFSDDSSRVPPPAQQYAEGYASVDQTKGLPQNMPHGAKVSSLIVTAKERENPEFRKGYGYASRWTPATRLVSTGSSAFEAGVYAGISDNPANQQAFVAAHRTAAAKYPALGQRVDSHRRVTVRIASKNEVPTSGMYVQAATSIELNTAAPNSTPAADGSTPINGPGRPGPLDGVQEAAAPGGPAPYNGAEPFGTPVVPNGAQGPSSVNPADALVGGGGMSTTRQLQGAFRQRVQAGLLAERKQQGK